MIDPHPLRAFMSTFYGYGSWNAKYWFVGMEEGGGDSHEEIECRVTTWQRRGGRALEDLHAYQEAICVTRHSGPAARIQSTWGKLIRVVLAAEGLERNSDSVRRYQSTQLGAATGDTLLIELLPLPAPSTGKWPYAAYGIPELATRNQYAAALAPERESAIQSRIDAERPANVIFYGLNYRTHWERISNLQFESVANRSFLVAEGPSTRFVIAPHPVARGVSNADFEDIGEWIAGRRSP